MWNSFCGDQHNRRDGIAGAKKKERSSRSLDGAVRDCAWIPVFCNRIDSGICLAVPLFIRYRTLNKRTVRIEQLDIALENLYRNLQAANMNAAGVRFSVAAAQRAHRYVRGRLENATRRARVGGAPIVRTYPGSC